MSKNLLLLLVICPFIVAQQKFFIKYKDNVPAQSIDTRLRDKSMLRLPDAARASGISFSAARLTDDPAVREERIGRIIRLSTNGNFSVDEIRNLLEDNNEIEYLEENKTYKVDSVPNDSLYSQQWALAKIDVVKAWEYTQGIDTVLVGVIDTGIDFNHPDIKNNIFINSGETGTDSLGNDKRTNGIDDDGNGFIDDWHGWDFVDRAGFPYDSTIGDYKNWDNDPTDEHPSSHGTAVAGILAAETNNGIGIAGVAPKLRVLVIRCFDPDGTSDEDDAAAGILYAVRMKAKVINMSWGDLSYSYVLRDVIQYAYSKNIVLVASAGNKNTSTPHYPSGFPGVISVGNSTQEDYVASNSSWGSTLSLVAPGTGIMAPARNNSYSEISGTSAAAPFVSATAGLILSMGNYSSDEVKQIIKSTTDDIGSEGWDERSGAGRLNTGRALQVLASSRIKFEYPIQNFTTHYDTVHVWASIMSSNFAEYSLSWGLGNTPSAWNVVVSGKKNQVFKSEIGMLSLKGFPDTALTLRIQVTLSNGRTLEERINIAFTRNLFDFSLVTPFAAYYGSSPTITSAVYTTNETVAKMHYRLKGTTEYAVISLDGLNVNNMFVQKLHYGFVPQGIIKPDTTYEVHFEIENLLGTRVLVYDSTGSDFNVHTSDIIHQSEITKLSYSLPKGTIFPNPINLTGGNAKDVLFSPYRDNSKTMIYSMIGSSFVLKDSLNEKIVKEVGDLNNDGLTDMLALWGTNGYLLSQNAANSPKMVVKNSVENGNFWPILAKDIDKDGLKEMLAIVKDSVCIYRINSDFQLTYLTSFKDFAKSKIGGNYFDYPSALVADVDNNGKNEIWMSDVEGNVLCYNVESSSKIVPDTIRSFATVFFSSASWLTAGDFDGDGRQEIALLMHSIENLHGSQYYRAVIADYQANKMSIMLDRCFIDPAAEFIVIAKTYENLRFAPVFSKTKDDFILNIFPYMYIFSWENNKPKIVLYRENLNTNCVFAGDLNQNGITDFGFASPDSFNFYEFTDPSLPAIPVDLTGRTIGGRYIQISWHGAESKYYIYKGNSADSLKLTDSVNTTVFSDNNVLSGSTYYYAVKSVNNSGISSTLSTPTSVYCHPVTHFANASVLPGRKVEVFFTERMPRTVYHLESCKLKLSASDMIGPVSVVLSGDKSFVISFNAELPAGTYQVFLSNLDDFYNSAVPDTTFNVTFYDEPVEKMFFIESFKLLDEHRLWIKYNYPADSISALDKSNYSLSPAREITGISFYDAQHSEIILTIAKGRPFGALGAETVLQIANIYSTEAYGKLKIKEKSAGSNIVLAFNAKNADEVFVYPNPVKLSVSNPQVTFANLPRYTEITIFNLSGKKIKTITGITGTGGITWNMRDEKNQEISTGVYFYLVRQLSENNDELSTKLQKFTVIK